MIASLLAIFILLVVFIRSPWGQDIVVKKATSFVSDKTQTTVSIDRLYITFSGNLFLEGLYLEDTEGDTLIYSRSLEAGVRIAPLISSGAIHITKLDWDGLKADVSRTNDFGKFNYEFLIEAFVTQEEQQEVTPDTTDQAPEPLELSFSSPIILSDFDILFSDEVTGIEASLVLESLEVKISDLDLEKSKYRISNVDLRNTQISYAQTKPFEPAEEDTAASVLPLITLDNLQLSNVSLDYNNSVDQQRAGLKIGDFTFQAPEIDLQNQIVEVDLVKLHHSDILFHDFGVSVDSTATSSGESTPFAWPEWTVNVVSISLDHNSVEYKTADQASQRGYFNPEVIVLRDLRLEAGDIFLENNQAGLKLLQTGFLEGSGFELKNFQFDLFLSDQESALDNLLIQTNRSQLSGQADLNFNSIQDLIDNPEGIDFEITLAETRLDVRDSYFFAPALAADTLIRKVASSLIRIEMELEGNLKSLTLPILDVTWNESSLKTGGKVTDALDIERLAFDFPQIELRTNRETLLSFVDSTQIGVTLPDSIVLTANALGSLDDLLANLHLQTELGDVNLNGRFQNNETLAFDADLNVDQLQLGALLDNPGLDTLSFTLSANGSGNSLNDLDAVLYSSFERLRINGNDYSGLGLDGKLTNGKGNIHLWLEDEFLEFDLLTDLELDSTRSTIGLNLDLIGIDLYELGFVGQSMRAALQLEANFAGNPSNFDLRTSLDDGLIVYDGRSYPMGPLNLNARIREDSTSVSIESLLLNGYLRSNTSPDSLITAVSDHFRQHLDELDSIGDPTGNITMLMDLSINEAPLLNKVLLKGMEKLDSARIKLDFSQPEDRLIATVDFPYVNYNGSEIDSLGIRINSDTEDLEVAFGFLALNAGPLAMDRTYFTGDLQQSRLYMDFNSFTGQEQTYHIGSDIGFSGDTLNLHISPENLLVNAQNWTVHENNLLQSATDYLNMEEFRFSRKNQELSLRNDLGDIGDEHFAVLFDNFNLETFTSLLNPQEPLAAGFMDGRLVWENPFGATGILGELDIDSLEVMATPLGNLSLNATSDTPGDYVLALSLKDGGMDLDLDGDFQADETGGNFDVRLNLNQIDMAVVAGLSGGELRDASGNISGLIEASGTTTDPQYTGEITFNDAAFVVSQFNANYLLANESIQLDNSGVYFRDFTIRDEDKNTFQIDGSVFTESFTNPSFDLKLLAESFSVVNSSREDNDLFYGTGIIDADVTITGDLNLPQVVADLTVKEETDLTVIIPESQLDIVEREGVVVFVNRKNPDDILTRETEETSGSSEFAGLDVRAIIQTDPEATFRVIVDESSGDNLKVSGEADLNLEINPNGRITLSGNYEIENGHYEMSLYNLVSRDFEIAEGSRITWNGDPMDATLSISAIYDVRTSSSELMASQLTSASGGPQSQYQQELPFLVYLNVDGELLRPEITFNLDMPENQRGALGGNVYSRVLQINEQEDELNKQVFSLLVLNRFFPSTGSDGSGGGTEAIARSSASQVLSSQLNAISGKLMGNSGVELDFDLDSFTDYQGNAPEERTQLNVNARKQLFDDRLVVSVGSQVDVEGSSQNSQQGNALIGNVSLEYLLTKNGRWRLRGFQRNEFESIIDGPLIVTGFGVIFNREFNLFRELWSGREENQNKENPIDELEKKNGTKKEEKPESKTDPARKEENEN